MSTGFICLISWGSHKFWLRILQLLKKKLKNTGSGKRTQFLGDSSQLGTRQRSGSPPGILTGFLGDGVGVGRRQAPRLATCSSRSRPECSPSSEGSPLPPTRRGSQGTGRACRSGQRGWPMGS